MKTDDLFPKEVRWVDTLSGLPFGVFYVDSKEARSLGASRWSYGLDWSYFAGVYFGGFAVPPGHVLYRQVRKCTDHGYEAAFQRNQGTLWWVGRFHRSYHAAIYHAQNVSVPPKWWLTTNPNTEDEGDEDARA